MADTKITGLAADVALVDADLVPAVIDVAGTPTTVKVTYSNFMRRKIVYKTALETLSSSSTLQNDDHLILPMGAPEIWFVEYTMFVGAASSDPDVKYSLSVPVACTWRLGAVGPIAGAAGADSDMRNISDTSGALALGAHAASDSMHLLRAYIVNPTNAGDAVLQWAQNTSDSDQLRVREGSYMVAYRYA